MVWSGRHGHFHWLVAAPSLRALGEIVVRFHLGARLCISAFDSGPICPVPEEEAAGWRVQGKIMISPPLTEGLEIPCDQYDEWYLFDRPPPPDWEPEVFVNYGGFTLGAIDEVPKPADPKWHPHGLDYLVPIQERFWAQLEQANPISYVAMGDQDIVVSKRREFIEQLRAGPAGYPN